MSEDACSVCGKKAIGYQIFGCCGSSVCEEHADPKLRNLHSGGKLKWGDCYFFRY
ncbi:MAG TPA: hypothetical protein HA264_08660 [Methanolinea sp.]|nr:hypothetical protein [Methanolinea sp.]